MSIIKFELPEEFEGITYESILARMLARVPDRYDKTEGGFVYDMIAPTALEVAELIQFWLALGIKTNFHMWARGKWLDYHAHDCGLTRHAATHAYTDVTVETNGAAKFPAGFIFSVPSDDNNPAIDFEVTETHSFTEAGTYTMQVRAVDAGTIGNVAAGSIVIMKNPIKPVTSITNLEASTGGVEAESDDSLRQRIDDFYAGHGASYVGNKGDYERWAREIDGVGYAHCIPCAPMWSSFFKVRDASDNPVQGTLELRAGDSPNEIKIVDISSTDENPHTLTGELAYNGVNSVRLVIADGNGDPANEVLLKQVEEYIFGTGHNDSKRLAPIGVAKYEVVAPALAMLSLELDVQYSTGATKSKVRSRIVKVMMNFIQSLSDDDNFYGEIKYSKVSALMSGVAGIEDFRNLKLNGGTINVTFLQDEVPFIDEEHVTINAW